MELQIDEKKFDAWLYAITKTRFTPLTTKYLVATAARTCIRILGEKSWYQLPTTRQVDCLDCYMAGWVDSRKSIKENFK